MTTPPAAQLHQHPHELTYCLPPPKQTNNVLRRLAAEFLTALARRKNTGVPSVTVWGSLDIPDTIDGECGGSHALLLAATAGWGDSPARQEPAPSPLLAQIVRVSARRIDRRPKLACVRRISSGVGFRL